MRLLIFLLLLSSFAFSVATYGSGTIQQCQSYDYCNVTTSSTITDSDFSITNRELIIDTGVTITLNRSRLLINSTERIWVKSGAIIQGSSNGRNGGSGGNLLSAVNLNTVLDGHTNGTNGTATADGGAGCSVPSGATGSGLLPFEYIPGSGGTSSGSAVTGGGFYATGAVKNEPSGGSCSNIQSAGSGQAIKFYSANITVDGSVLSNAFNSSISITSGTRAAGGSGAGEILYYGYQINLTGSTTAIGGTGASGVSGRSASGGAGGIIKFCAKNTIANSTQPLASGGSGSGGGSTGSNGQVITTSSNNTCFYDVVTDILEANSTNFITNNPAGFTVTFPVSVGVFNSSNVSCAYILDGAYTNLGQYNYSGFTNFNVPILGSSAGTHTFAITCANASVGISNHTSIITYHITDVSPYPPPFVSITSPTNGSSYINPFPVTLGATVQSALFNSCTAYINNVSIGSFSGSTYSNDYSGYLLFVGTNSFTVSCEYLLGGYNTSTVLFSYTSTSATNPFLSAFDLDISSCPLNTYNELIEQCTEYYRTPSVFNFSAVPCRALNLSLNYSCLSSLSNVTKVGDFYNYTIFYTPSYWNYSGAVGIPNKSLDLTGAEFIYNSKFVTHGGGMELIDNDSFLYIPAQHKPVDCGYYYTGFYGTSCSYGYGFIVNNRIVMVADNTNQWYTASGVGVANNSLVPGQPVIYVNVIPLPGVTTDPFVDGIYTRYVCNEQNGTYVINLLNTVQQSYTIFITTNTSGVINQTSISSSSVALSQIINMSNVVNLTVYDSNSIVCSSANQNTLFLPFNIFNGDLTDGFSNFIVKMVMLFTVVVSAIIPYFLIVTFILNDVYHVISINDLGILTAIIFITGIANNIFATEKGIKNMVIVMAMCITYLMLLYTHTQSYISTEVNQITTLFNSVSDLVNATELSDQIIGFGIFIVNLFILILTAPIAVVGLLKMIMFYIMPPAIFTPISIVFTFVGYGAVIFYYLKAYEVITNRFRGV